jgi:basic amino acid/polyamine antiporter, APA family
MSTLNTRTNSQLIRALGPVMLGAAIINVIVGGGIFRLPATLSADLGSASPLAFVLGALLMLPVTLCFAAVGSRVVDTGGPYSYLHVGFGPSAGFVAGALMWIGNITSSAGIAAALFDLLALYWPQAAELRVLCLVVLYGILIALNCYGVALGGRVLVAFATLKLAPLFLLVLAGLFLADFSSLTWTSVPSAAALGTSMVAVIFAYSGIETALTPSGEVRDPARDVPRAALMASLLVIVLYVGIQSVCQAVLGAKLATDTTAVASAAGALWQPGKTIVLITMAISMSGFLMGNLLGSARVAYALGRDGFLPSALSAISQRGVPHWAIVVHASLACALACVGQFEFLILMSAGANCLIYLGVAAVAWRLHPSDAEHVFKMPGGAYVMPVLASAAMLFVLSTLGRQEWLAMALSLAALSAVNLGMRLRAKHKTEVIREN